MRLRNLIASELRERPAAMLASVLAIALGVTAFVALRTVTLASEDSVARELSSLGANVLMLPKGTTLENYYAADMNGKTLPEEHAMSLALANLQGVERISPRLCVPAELAGRGLTLTGILPQSDFQALSAGVGGELFSNAHQGCRRACARPAGTGETFTAERAIQSLAENEALLGADVAEFAGVQAGGWITLLGEPLRVVTVLSRTGTVDDSRVFTHLHTVQRIAKTGEVVGAIEIMGCCEDVAGTLVSTLGEMFPDARIVTISQVVEAQVGVNRTMSQLSSLVFVVLIVLGGASTASTMYSNVAERRREVGTLMALGATPGFVSRLFLTKAGLLGLAGGACGAVAGTILALVMGPRWAGVSVTAAPGLGMLAVAVSLAVALTAALLPARRAAGLDPCLCFKEV